MAEDDPIRKRAEEIRAEEALATQAEADRDRDLRAERVRLATKFSDALSDRTGHAVRCSAVDDAPHSAFASFDSLRGGQVVCDEMFDFGIARIEGEPGCRMFKYYLEPSRSAFAIPNPATGVARAIKEGSEADVLSYAVAISIEMMARVVAAGGVLGSVAEIEAALKEQDRRQEEGRRRERRASSARFWRGCLTGIAWFFGLLFAVGIFGSLLRACSGG